jgi:hypothetical protein
MQMPSRGCLNLVLREDETYALHEDMTRSDALAYWLASDHRTCVAPSRVAHSKPLLTI